MSQLQEQILRTLQQGAKTAEKIAAAIPRDLRTVEQAVKHMSRRGRLVLFQISPDGTRWWAHPNDPKHLEKMRRVREYHQQGTGTPS